MDGCRHDELLDHHGVCTIGLPGDRLNPGSPRLRRDRTRLPLLKRKHPAPALSLCKRNTRTTNRTHGNWAPNASRSHSRIPSLLCTPNPQCRRRKSTSARPRARSSTSCTKSQRCWYAHACLAEAKIRLSPSSSEGRGEENKRKAAKANSFIHLTEHEPQPHPTLLLRLADRERREPGSPGGASSFPARSLSSSFGFASVRKS